MKKISPPCHSGCPYYDLGELYDDLKQWETPDPEDYWTDPENDLPPFTDISTAESLIAEFKRQLNIWKSFCRSCKSLSKQAKEKKGEYQEFIIKVEKSLAVLKVVLSPGENNVQSA